MERYIKPNCEAIMIAADNSILAGSLGGSNQISNTVGFTENGTVSWHAPKQNSITPSLTQPDFWKEEEGSDIDYYMEAYEK